MCLRLAPPFRSQTPAPFAFSHLSQRPPPRPSRRPPAAETRSNSAGFRCANESPHGTTHDPPAHASRERQGLCLNSGYEIGCLLRRWRYPSRRQARPLPSPSALFRCRRWRGCSSSDRAFRCCASAKASSHPRAQPPARLRYQRGRHQQR